ncbi:hypothetical protein [Peribacillus simplex]|uniref:hypothetical protein n=1 Tax=Peribacillus simplex TaxID=1478 RepID=UPI00366CDCF7
MFSSSNQAIFDPGYIFLLLIILGIVYLVYFALIVVTIKLNALIISTLTISFITYLIVGFYMAGTSYYMDEHPDYNLVFIGYGFPDLILLAFPYIFLSLAASLGEKKQNK